MQNRTTKMSGIGFFFWRGIYCKRNKLRRKQQGNSLLHTILFQSCWTPEQQLHSNFELLSWKFCWVVTQCNALLLCSLDVEIQQHSCTPMSLLTLATEIYPFATNMRFEATMSAQMVILNLWFHYLSSSKCHVSQ